jgi:hypothetical protein
VSSRAIVRVDRWRREYNVYGKPREADGYHWFVLRFWQLYQAAKAIRANVTVRQLDMYLLSPARAAGRRGRGRSSTSHPRRRWFHSWNCS